MCCLNALQSILVPYNNIEKYDYWMGMTPDMAIVTMGRPNDINRTVTKYSTDKQWVYNDADGIPNTFLYFENGKLNSWQD